MTLLLQLDLIFHLLLDLLADLDSLDLFSFHESRGVGWHVWVKICARGGREIRFRFANTVIRFFTVEYGVLGADFLVTKRFFDVDGKVLGCLAEL